MSKNESRTTAHSKKKIYAAYNDLFKTPIVNVVNLSIDDIKKYKLTYKNEDFKSYIEESYGYIPPQKKIKKSENGKEILNLVISRESGTDKFKSQIKSTTNNDKENLSSVNDETTKYGDVCEEESKNPPENTYGKIAVRDPKLMMEKHRYVSFVQSFFGNYLKPLPENDEKTITPPANDINIIIPPANGENAITPPEDHTNTITSPANVKNTKTPSEDGKNTITPPANGKNTITPTENGKKTITCPKNSKITITPVTNDKKITTNVSLDGSILTKGNLSLGIIDHLYYKYFNKTMQDSIAIIAHILNVISISNRHHKSRMDQSFKMRTEAEKLKGRFDANKQHLRHKKVLEPKLHKYFKDCISIFIDSELEPAFQLFFLGILTLLRILDQPKYKKGSIFKNLVLLLWNSLRNDGFEHAKIFNMFRSKLFRTGCIDMIGLIEESRTVDPSIIDRMSLFFTSSINEECFKLVIDAVTKESNMKLGVLIDKAANFCRLNSKFKDPIDYSSLNVKNSIITNKSPTTSIQNTNKKHDNGGVKPWTIAQNTNGTYQPISMANESQIQKSNKPTLRNKSEIQPLNTYYETFSNSLLPSVSSEIATTNVIAPKVSVIALPSAASTSSGPTTTLVAFKPTVHNMKPITTPIQRSEGNTIILGNKQYQLIRGPPTIQRKLLPASPTIPNRNIMIRRQPQPSDNKCSRSNCSITATIMCSCCKAVKYCTHKCQRLDWYDSHIYKCDELKSIEQQRTARK